MTWAALRPGLLALVADLSALNVSWEDQPRKQVNSTTRAAIYLALGRPRRIGHDELSSQDVVGTAVTVDTSTNVVTAVAHGLANDAPIRFVGDDLPEPLANATLYYVIAATADTFKVSLTIGGSAVDIATAGADTGFILGGEEIEDITHGVRRMSLQIKRESYEQGDTRAAYEFLERVRDRFARRSTTAALNALSAGLISTEDVVDYSDTRDGRRVSIAVLDVQLSWAAREVDSTHRYSQITSVGLRGTADGTTVIDATIGV